MMSTNPSRFSLGLLLCVVAGMAVTIVITVLHVRGAIEFYDMPNGGMSYGLGQFVIDPFGTVTGIQGLTVGIYCAIAFSIGHALHRSTWDRKPTVIATICFTTFAAIIIQASVEGVFKTKDFCNGKYDYGRVRCIMDLARSKQDILICQNLTRVQDIKSCIEDSGFFYSRYTLERCNAIDARPLRAYCKAYVLEHERKANSISCLQSEETMLCDKYYSDHIDSFHYVITPDEIIRCPNGAAEKCGETFLRQREAPEEAWNILL